MSYDSNILRERISTIIKKLESLDKGEAVDFAFHMTDWISELENLNNFYSNPLDYSDEDVERILLDFLSHVPEHVVAAKKMMLGVGVSDTFQVGAIETEHTDGEEE